MHKLHGIKVVAAGAIALLSLTTIAASDAFAQDTPKPAAQENQKPAAQTEPMGCCSCCKKMAAQKPNDSQNKMPGMNHPAPTGK
ncbi:hypothetical protein H6F76_11475 [Leptolyngbya sp. FACHB-321]|uniref:hypothetical protein n=1 Tax=Leptolyngbya sp. FACHB-321 TaxID=2692807 RepID=UPI0016894C10|nr:hypothetical protein [Leptolyngbya sp. FACHB-321]MBD2035640.1 hypothetical protein [Leptolyngbya sp. FACHB-321]